MKARCCAVLFRGYGAAEMDRLPLICEGVLEDLVSRDEGVASVGAHFLAVRGE